MTGGDVVPTQYFVSCCQYNYMSKDTQRRHCDTQERSKGPGLRAGRVAQISTDLLHTTEMSSTVNSLYSSAHIFQVGYRRLSVRDRKLLITNDEGGT